MRVRPPKKRADSPLVEFLENGSFLIILLKTSASLASGSNGPEQAKVKWAKIQNNNDVSSFDSSESFKVIKEKKIFQSPTSLRYVPGVALVVLTKGPLPS